MKSKLGKLRHKFDFSGIHGNPIITDSELQELRDRMQELINFMADSKNQTMEYAFQLELQRINQVIEARKEA
jgi:hypothetical protein